MTPEREPCCDLWRQNQDYLWTEKGGHSYYLCGSDPGGWVAAEGCRFCPWCGAKFREVGGE